MPERVEKSSFFFFILVSFFSNHFWNLWKVYVHFYIDLKEENQEANQEQEKAKKGKKGDRDKGRAQRGVPQFFQGQEKVEKEKAKFPKPE